MCAQVLPLSFSRVQGTESFLGGQSDDTRPLAGLRRRNVSATWGGGVDTGCLPECLLLYVKKKCGKGVLVLYQLSLFLLCLLGLHAGSERPTKL